MTTGPKHQFRFLAADHTSLMARLTMLPSLVESPACSFAPQEDQLSARHGHAVAISACGLRFGGPSRPFHTFAVGTNNLHAAARAGVDRQPKSVQLYDRGYQIQAKTH